MNIHEIADRLNELAANTKPFNQFQSIRAQIKGLTRPRSNKIFTASTVFDNEGDSYAFHDGGRSEMQFNIGVEYFEDEEIFRYGLGFSLEPNQSQPDPINYLTPKIKIFNEYQSIDTGLLNNLIVWHYREPGKAERSNDYTIRPIPNEWIVWGNFIFIGKYFRKGIDDLEENDLHEIIQLFNRLLPVFEFVESNASKHQLGIDGERISRICWNEFGWVKPSGRSGKSLDKDTHEGKYGYGHEEWLGDLSKIATDGYHYGFLETIREIQESLAGKRFNIDLFTINGVTHERFFVGKIKNVEVIDKEKASEIKNQYQKNGWSEEMQNQIISVGANADGFSDWKKLNFFNVRYKPEDLQLFSDYVLINDEKIKDIHRYTLVYKTAEINVSIPINRPFVFVPSNIDLDSSNDGDVESSKYKRDAKPIEITYLHKKIRDALHVYLVRKYGNSISKENPTGQGTLIDVVRKDKEMTIFYEIKTYYNLKSCLREAIGQLFEYAFWPNEENAEELIVVSQNEITPDGQSYLNKLRNKYKIPVYYQQFDLVKNDLSEKY